MIMERTIQLVSMMPAKSKRQETLTNSFIDQLWNSLDHPPLLYMGDEFKYRQPDGSNNVRLLKDPYFNLHSNPSGFCSHYPESIAAKARCRWYAIFTHSQAWTGQHGITA